MTEIKSITNTHINPKDLLDKYNFQPILTPKLDNLKNSNVDFNQEIINEIVLWKVDRYAKLDDETLKLLNKIKPDLTEFNEKQTKEILESLLKNKGIGLPMASTVLRFKNPNIYQIIDKRAYRFLYGENKPNSANIEKRINLYIQYLKDLKNWCNNQNINFIDSDRILYEADKKHNEALKIDSTSKTKK